jgi:hypothetical protein
MTPPERRPPPPFDFDAAVTAPFRMQPGLRKLAPGALQFTPLDPDSPVFAAKLAVLRAEPEEALLADAGFDDGPACRAIAAELATQRPADFVLEGDRLAARRLGALLDLRRGAVDLRRARAADAAAPAPPSGAAPSDRATPPPASSWADVLDRLPHARRRQALLALAVHEDLAVIDGASTRLRWLAVCVPSHWAPGEKIGRPFAEVHAPVADNALLVSAGAHLARLVTQPQRWERFVWNLTPHAGLDQHPRRHPKPAWPLEGGPAAVGAAAWMRTERQTFVPLPDEAQAVFTIHVGMDPLSEVARDPRRAHRLHDAVASMSDAVLAYRGLAAAREPLLRWLAERTQGEAGAPHRGAPQREAPGALPGAA